jgi:hypothetical protein
VTLLQGGVHNTGMRPENDAVGGFYVITFWAHCSVVHTTLQQSHAPKKFNMSNSSPGQAYREPVIKA